jgi:hypothetical protein
MVLKGLKKITMPQMVVSTGPRKRDTGASVSLRTEIRFDTSPTPIIKSIAPNRNMMIPAKNAGNMISIRPKIRLAMPLRDSSERFFPSSGFFEKTTDTAPNNIRTEPITMMMVLTAVPGQMIRTIPNMAAIIALE